MLGLLAVPRCALFLYRTPTGAKPRAAGGGEPPPLGRHPHRRDEGIVVAISGVLAGLAGPRLAIDKLHFFLAGHDQRRRLHRPCRDPVRRRTSWVTAAPPSCSLFGALGDHLQAFAIPSRFVLMLPYVAAIVGLVAARWRALVRNRPAKSSEAPAVTGRGILLDCDPGNDDALGSSSRPGTRRSNSGR